MASYDDIDLGNIFVPERRQLQARLGSSADLLGPAPGDLTEEERQRKERERALSRPLAVSREQQIADMRRSPNAGNAILDNDLFDQAAQGFTNALSGANRAGQAVLRGWGKVGGVDLLKPARPLYDAAADLFEWGAETGKSATEYVDKKWINDTTKAKNAQEALDKEVLAARYGGKENIPYYVEALNAIGDFVNRPLDKTASAIGSSIPILTAAVVPGGGLSAVVIASGILGAGDAGGSAYDVIMAMDETILQKDPDYQEMLAAGTDAKDARKAIAEQATRVASVPGAVVGAAGGYVGGRAGAESILLKGTSAVTGKSFGKKIAVETLQEGVEGAATQASGNLGVKTVDPNQSLMEDVVAAGVQEATAGFGMTTVIEGAQKLRESRLKEKDAELDTGTTPPSDTNTPPSDTTTPPSDTTTPPSDTTTPPSDTTTPPVDENGEIDPEIEAEIEAELDGEPTDPATDPEVDPDTDTGPTEPGSGPDDTNVDDTGESPPTEPGAETTPPDEVDDGPPIPPPPEDVIDDPPPTEPGAPETDPYDGMSLDDMRRAALGIFNTIDLLEDVRQAQTDGVAVPAETAQQLEAQGLSVDTLLKDGNVARAIGRMEAKLPDMRAAAFAQNNLALGPKVVAAIRRNDIIGSLQAFVETTENVTSKTIAQRLLSVNPKTNIGTANLGPKWAGEHYWAMSGLEPGEAKRSNASKARAIVGNQRRSADGTLVAEPVTVLNEKSGLNDHTYLHEVAHALTVYAINNPATEAQQQAKKDLQDIFAVVKKEGVAAGRYGMTNLAEFVAEAYSNPQFQKLLQMTPYKAGQGSLWNRFLRTIGRLFGTDNALTATFVAVENLRPETQTNANTKSKGQQGYSPFTRPGSSSATPVRSPRGLGRKGQADGGSATGANNNGRSDNRRVPNAGATAGADARATGQAEEDVIAQGQALAGAGVTNNLDTAAVHAVAMLDDASRLELDVAAGVLKIGTPQLVAELNEQIESRGIDAVVTPLPAPLRAAVRNAAANSAVRTGRTDQLKKFFAELVPADDAKINSNEDLFNVMQGKGYPTQQVAAQTGRMLREKFVDSATPFLRMLGMDQRHPLWQTFKLAQSSHQTVKKALLLDIDALDRRMYDEAKKAGMKPRDFFKILDRFATAEYVANGANDELADTQRRTITEAEQQRQDYVDKYPDYADDPRRAMHVEVLSNKIYMAQQWLTMYTDINNTIRKDRDNPAHTLVGGLTKAEAQEALNVAMRAHGPVAFKAFQDASEALRTTQRKWASKAEDAGVYNKDETDNWPSRRFAATSGKFYVPTSGVGLEGSASDPLMGHDAIYGLGGQVYRDKARGGRVSMGDGAYMATMSQLAGFARRISHKPFTDALYEYAETQPSKNPNENIFAVRAHIPTPGHPFTFAHKKFNPATGKTEKWKIVLRDQEAAQSIIGANRNEVDNVVANSIGSVTRFTGFMVTQAVLAFGPINMVRDFGEKAYTLAAKYPDTIKNPAAFAARAGRLLLSPEAIRAVTEFAYTGDTEIRPGDSAHMKTLKEMATMGALSTRTGAVNRESRKIVRQIERQNPGWRQGKQLMHLIGTWNEAFEMLPALATYTAMTESATGVVNQAQREQFAFRVLDVMNFNQSGTASPWLRTLYLFFNPTVQGARNTYESMVRGITVGGARGTPASSRKRIMAAGALAGAFALYAITREMGGEDDDYGNLVDGMHGSTVARAIPFRLPGTDRVLKVPVPFGAQSVLWSLAVNISRYAHGASSEKEAILGALTGAAEHTVPFPLSKVDVTDDPSFWFLKTLAPQIAGPILNVASGKNDFGWELFNKYADSQRPDAAQGKKSTEQAWKNAALAIARQTGGAVDMAPEALRELTRMVAVGPLEGLMKYALNVETLDGRPEHWETIIGSNRIVAPDTKGLVRNYYGRANEMNKLFRSAELEAGQRPAYNRKKGQAEIDLKEWLAKTGRSVEEQSLMAEFKEHEKRLRKAREGKILVTEEQVMREFLRNYNKRMGLQ